MKKHPCHKDQLVALRRIEGQIRGIQGMVDDGKYCVDILTQIGAVKGALTRVEDKILEKHLKSCVEGAVKGGKKAEKDQKLAEIFKLIRQTRKGYK